PSLLRPTWSCNGNLNARHGVGCFAEETIFHTQFYPIAVSFWAQIERTSCMQVTLGEPPETGSQNTGCVRWSIQACWSLIQKGHALRFATLAGGARIRYAEPGRKAGTDRRTTVDTTVSEGIPEGRRGLRKFRLAKRSRI